MDVDLAKLREMHPRLPVDLALALATRAALALERNAHTAGVRLTCDLEAIVSASTLWWPSADLSAMDQHDRNRITEDGAEALALGLAHVHRAWRVVRRMQREEHADWLLEDTSGAVRQIVALEVSGVDRGDIASRLATKLAQVAKSPDVHQRWAGVVGFEEPRAALRSTTGQGDGH